MDEVDGITYVCFEEIPENEGTSVTNFSEQLATEVVAVYGLDPSRCRFFELYRHLDSDGDTTLDEIRYTWYGPVAANPQWKPYSEPEFFKKKLFSI